MRWRRKDPATQNAMTAVCVLLACQGFVGATQYALELPAEIVWFHVVLSALTWIALLVAAAAAGRIVRGDGPAAAAAEPAPERELAPRCTVIAMRPSSQAAPGFIGSHLVDALLAQGDEVTVVDHLIRAATTSQASAARARLRARRRHRRARDAEAFAAARPEVVYHLAAQIDVRRSVEDPSTDAHVNVGGTASVLTAALAAGVRQVVLASTAGVYGDPQRVPTPETERGRAALALRRQQGGGRELPGRCSGRLHGLSTLSLRMSNVYGPRQNPHGEAGVIAIFCGAAVEQRPVTIFGDGGQTRDFVFVGDVVEAFVRAGALGREWARSTSATGSETIARPSWSTRSGWTATTVPGRLGEIRRSCLDPRAAARTRSAGRRARRSPEGLERTLASLRRADFAQPSRVDVVDEAAHGVLVRDERAALDAADRAAHVVVEVGEGLGRPRSA